MRYFIDVDPIREQLSILAEDGRELTVFATEAEAAEQVTAFTEATKYGPATVWMFDEDTNGELVDSVWPGQDVEDVLAWAKEVGAPTLPGRSTKQASGRWVQDAWAFLCRYTGEDMAPESVEKQEEGTHRVDPEKGIVSPSGGDK